MPANWNGILSTGRSEAVHRDSRLPLPVAICIHPRARRLKLRLDESSELLLLTCPPRSSRKAALDWAASQRPWVEARLAEAEPATALSPGSFIPFEGQDTLLAWTDGGARKIVHLNGILSVGAPRMLSPGGSILAPHPSSRSVVGRYGRRRPKGRGQRSRGKHRGCWHALGQLLLFGRHPLQLAVGACPSGGPPLGRRA